jgi:hypothetical protein
MIWILSKRALPFVDKGDKGEACAKEKKFPRVVDKAKSTEQ